ncbi:MAG: guanylate cyclase [Sneathiella sp.]|nr:MAG: guanylate cyclase [Sneathiella sp.]
MMAVAELVARERPAASNKYSIGIHPVPERIQGFKDGVRLVDTTNALIVRETHLVPIYYIPREDVAMDYFSRTDFRTFCPFKGNASHWALTLGDHQSSPAAWSYETPFLEAEPVKNHIAFYGDVFDKWVRGEEEEKYLSPRMLLAEPENLVDWLIRGAWAAKNHVELTAQLGNRLVQTGIPVARLNVALRQLHPLVAGRSYIWRRKSNEVEEFSISHTSLNGPGYLNSPMKLVSEGLGGIRQRLDVDEENFEFSIMAELKAQGATDYVALPLPFSDGIIHNLTLTSDAPEGFSTSDLGQIFEALPLISRMYEVHKVKSDSKALLETYLGKSAGNKVLNGLVKRGDGETIQAVIYFCDLSDSTALTEKLGQQKYLNHLNKFFDASAVSVAENGGDVLKFIGDAILAIFPIKDTSKEEIARACQQAAKAARSTITALAEIKHEAPMHCTIGLHHGEVMYGNVGSEDRLDFTVIGSATNETARIGEICKEIGHAILLSDDVATHIPEDVRSVGAFALKGVAEKRELFCFETANEG